MISKISDIYIDYIENDRKLSIQAGGMRFIQSVFSGVRKYKVLFGLRNYRSGPGVSSRSSVITECGSYDIGHARGRYVTFFPDVRNIRPDNSGADNSFLWRKFTLGFGRNVVSNLKKKTYIPDNRVEICTKMDGKCNPHSLLWG